MSYLPQRVVPFNSCTWLGSCVHGLVAAPKQMIRSNGRGGGKAGSRARGYWLAHRIRTPSLNYTHHPVLCRNWWWDACRKMFIYSAALLMDLSRKTTRRAYLPGIFKKNAVQVSCRCWPITLAGISFQSLSFDEAARYSLPGGGIGRSWSFPAGGRKQVLATCVIAIGLYIEVSGFVWRLIWSYFYL